MLDSGKYLREISLQSDFRNPQHALQLTAGQSQQQLFRRLSRRHVYGSLHGVCLVDTEGKVVCSYDGQRDSDGRRHPSWPRHLAVDKDSQFIFVADEYSRGVVSLSPTLEFVRNFGEVALSSGSSRLFLHQATRCLFVTDGRNSVVVVQL